MSKIKGPVIEKKEKKILIMMTIKDHNIVKEKAIKYTGGNISRWLRYAAINLEPRREDLEDAN